MLDDMLLKNAQRIRDDEKMCFAMSVPYFISNDHLNNAQMQEINETYGEVDKNIALAQFEEIASTARAASAFIWFPPHPVCRTKFMCQILVLFSKATKTSRR